MRCMPKPSIPGCLTSPSGTGWSLSTSTASAGWWPAMAANSSASSTCSGTASFMPGCRTLWSPPRHGAGTSAPNWSIAPDAAPRRRSVSTCTWTSKIIWARSTTGPAASGRPRPVCWNWTEVCLRTSEVISSPMRLNSRVLIAAHPEQEDDRDRGSVALGIALGFFAILSAAGALAGPHFGSGTAVIGPTIEHRRQPRPASDLDDLNIGHGVVVRILRHDWNAMGDRGGRNPAVVDRHLPAWPSPSGPLGRQRLRRSRVGPEDPFCEAVRKDLRVPLTLEGPTWTMRGVPSRWL